MTGDQTGARLPHGQAFGGAVAVARVVARDRPALAGLAWGLAALIAAVWMRMDGVLLLVDGEIGPTAADLQTVEWLRHIER